ncbi:hypothetical protein ACV56Z_00260 [Staphylococcus aureus]
MFGNDTYGWDKVFGLEETTKEKISVLDGGDSSMNAIFQLYSRCHVFK